MRNLQVPRTLKFSVPLLVLLIGAVNCIEWIDVRSGDDVLHRKDIVAGGKEYQLVTTYVCRAWHDGRWVPGKVVVASGRDAKQCYVAEFSQVHQYEDFQILTKGNKYPWWVVPPNRFTAPKYAVEGGNHPNGETAFICRAKIAETDELVVGKYSENDGACYYAWRNEEYVNENNFEVLERGPYGKKKLT